MTATAEESLAHFRAVRDGVRLPRFMVARTQTVPVGADRWEAHAEALAGRSAMERRDASSLPSMSLLDLKIALAEAALNACDLCPHLCYANRNQGKTGFCGVADRTAVHWEGVLSGEEIDLVPSHEVFLSGCTMRCAFCYSHEHITRPMSGLPMLPSELAGLVQKRHSEGATNLNLVGGEPTVHIPNILRTLRHLEAPLPVIWNSNMYATPKAMALLDGVVDLFLGDIHFGNDDCAGRLGLIPNYSESVHDALVAAVQSGASVIIRHLVMPGHLECCARTAMEWAKATLPGTPFHLMFQYVPDYRAVRDPILGRFLSAEEIRRAKAIAAEVGVDLYQESTGITTPLASTPDSDQAVDILIQGDGRVSFTRLLPDLLPVAAALNDGDSRIQARSALAATGEQ